MNRTTSEAAAELGCSTTWLYRNASWLPHHRRGRKYVFTDQDIAEIGRRTARNYEPPRVVRDPSAPITRRRAS